MSVVVIAVPVGPVMIYIEEVSQCPTRLEVKNEPSPPTQSGLDGKD